MRSMFRLCLLGIFLGSISFPGISFGQPVEGDPEASDEAVMAVPEQPEVVDLPVEDDVPGSRDLASDGEAGLPDVLLPDGMGMAVEDAPESLDMLVAEAVPDDPDAEDAGGAEDDAFSDVLAGDALSEMRLPNPAYEIEQIRITGNSQTSRENILKMLALDTSRPVTLESLEAARIRLAASGLFQSADMRLMPGSGSGRLGIDLQVEERSRIQVNRYFVGVSRKTPFWMGLDVEWLALMGTNHRYRMAFAAAGSEMYTLDMNYLVPMIRDLPVSLMFSVQSMRSREGLYGPSRGGVWSALDRIQFERHGATAGVGYAPIPHVRLMLRLEYMRLLRQNDSAEIRPQLDSYLADGWSGLAAVHVMAAYDSREGRDLPNSGHFVSLGLNGAARMAISQYGFFKIRLAHQSNFEVSPQHVLRIDTFGGALFGDAPFFEKFFFNDFYAMAPGRIHYLNPSNCGAYDLFGTGASSLSYEDFLFHLALTYAWQPFVRRLELFVTAAATYADTPSHGRRVLGIDSRATRGTFPVDMSFNLGVRVKTDYGLISVSLSNVFDLLGR
ncbi:MAG: BamA/TamA family outer membrane protein [Proteobacteria bacterium]|nr:BamA/TamA family outer membrane protein [Pseudomonadota bacterium]